MDSPSKVNLGYWQGKQGYVIDSAKVDKNQSIAQFSLPGTTKAGLYFFQLAGQNETVDFVLNNETDLRFETYKNGWVDSFHVHNSIENKPYWNWKHANIAQKRKMEQMNYSFDMLKRATKERDVLNEFARNIQQVRIEMDSLTRLQLVGFPNLFFPKIINASLPPVIPPSIPYLAGNGKINETYVRYYYQHFWDTYDFSDERLLRTPMLPLKFDLFIQSQQGTLDSVQSNITNAISRASVNTQSKNELIYLLLERFDAVSAGTNEALLVWLFDKFVPTASAVGMDTTTWIRLEYKVNAYRPTLQGLVAPNIELPNTQDSLIRLSDFKARYTLVYFFSPLCEHCKKITPEVYALSQEFDQKGIRVFAVTTDGNVDYWKDYVKNNVPLWTAVMDSKEPSPVEQLYATFGLPNALLLDADKKILIRRIPLNELKSILENLPD